MTDDNDNDNHGSNVFSHTKGYERPVKPQRDYAHLDPQSKNAVDFAMDDLHHRTLETSADKVSFLGSGPQPDKLHQTYEVAAKDAIRAHEGNTQTIATLRRLLREQTDLLEQVLSEASDAAEEIRVLRLAREQVEKFEREDKVRKKLRDDYADSRLSDVTKPHGIFFVLAWSGVVLASFGIGLLTGML